MGGRAGRYSVGDIRAGLEAEAVNRGVGLQPLCVECVPAGQRGEERPPGLYWTDPVRRCGPVIVFEGESPPEALLARFRPRDGSPGPLIVVLGPEGIPAPLGD